jgi:hypothetical protein
MYVLTTIPPGTHEEQSKMARKVKVKAIQMLRRRRRRRMKIQQPWRGAPVCSCQGHHVKQSTTSEEVLARRSLKAEPGTSRQTSRSE